MIICYHLLNFFAYMHWLENAVHKVGCVLAGRNIEKQHPQQSISLGGLLCDNVRWYFAFNQSGVLVCVHAGV